METIPGGDDLERNNEGTTTALCTEWVQDESGEVNLRTYHTTARNHSWTVGVPEFHCAQSGLGHYCNGQERKTVTGNREAARARGRGPAGGG